MVHLRHLSFWWYRLRDWCSLACTKICPRSSTWFRSGTTRSRPFEAIAVWRATLDILHRHFWFHDRRDALPYQVASRQLQLLHRSLQRQDLLVGISAESDQNHLVEAQRLLLFWKQDLWLRLSWGNLKLGGQDRNLPPKIRNLSKIGSVFIVSCDSNHL